MQQVMQGPVSTGSYHKHFGGEDSFILKENSERSITIVTSHVAVFYTILIS